MADVITTFRTDAKDMERAMQRMQKEVAALKQELRSAGQASKESAKDAGHMGGAVSDVVSGVAKMAAGYLSVHGAMKLVTVEMEHHAKLQRDAVDAQKTLADARKGMLRNLGDVTNAERTQTLRQVHAMARETGISESVLSTAAGTALSARGAAPAAAALGAVRGAAKFMPDSPEGIPTVAGAVLDLAKVTGTYDAKTNIGYLQAIGQMARVTTIEEQAANLSPAVIGVKQMGGTAQSAGALVTALTTGMADVSGRKSGTASIQLAKQLREALPKLPGLQERIEAMQANPALAKRFLAKGSFETKALGPIEALLTDRESMVSQAYRSNLAGIPSPENAGAFADRIIAGYAVDPAERVAETLRRGGVGVQAQQINDPRAAGRAMYDQAMAALDATSTGYLGGTWSAMRGKLASLGQWAYQSTGSEMAGGAGELLGQRISQMKRRGEDTAELEVLKDMAEKLARILAAEERAERHTPAVLQGAP